MFLNLSLVSQTHAGLRGSKPCSRNLTSHRVLATELLFNFVKVFFSFIAGTNVLILVCSAFGQQQQWRKRNLGFCYLRSNLFILRTSLPTGILESQGISFWSQIFEPQQHPKAIRRCSKKRTTTWIDARVVAPSRIGEYQAWLLCQCINASLGIIPTIICILYRCSCFVRSRFGGKRRLSARL